MAGKRRRIDFQSIFRLTELADYIIPFTIGVIADLGVADRLTEGPRSVDELAMATGAHAPSLHRALRALACKGIFTETEPNYFGLTPMAELLRTDHPLSLRRICLVMPADVQAWAKFDYSIRTGESAFEHVHGLGFWDYLASHPEESGLFDSSMAAMTRLELLTVLRAYDWSGLRKVVDIGGGNGTFLAGLLERCPAMRGVLFDLPHVTVGASAVLNAARVAERCEVVSGSYFESVPAGQDAYLLKRILYSCNDHEATGIMNVVRSAMRPDSRLLVIEPIWHDGNDYDVGKILDLQMLILGEGRVRNQEGLEQLLTSEQLRLVRLIRTPMTSIIEAHPI
jgi:SAM-dependent methyltransferase